MAYSLTQTPGFIEIRFWGTTTLEEVIRLMDELSQREGAETPAPFLVDLVALEQIDVDYEGVTRMFEHRDGLNPPDLGSRIAIVATAPHIFGMARMVELRNSEHASTARAFREREEAVTWLAANPPG